MSDLYTRVIASVLEIPEAEVTKAQRAHAKSVCFAAVYRATPTPRTAEETFKELCEVVGMAKPALRRM